MQITPLHAPHDTTHLPFFARQVCTARGYIDTANNVLVMDSDAADAHMGTAASAAGNAAEHLYDLEQVHGPEEALREALVAADILANCAQQLEDPEDGGDFGRAQVRQQLLNADRTLAAIEHALGIVHAEA